MAACGEAKGLPAGSHMLFSPTPPANQFHPTCPPPPLIAAHCVCPNRPPLSKRAMRVGLLSSPGRVRPPGAGLHAAANQQVEGLEGSKPFPRCSAAAHRWLWGGRTRPGVDRRPTLIARLLKGGRFGQNAVGLDSEAMMGRWLKLIFFDQANLAGLCLRLVDTAFAELTLCLLFFLELSSVIYIVYFLAISWGDYLSSSRVLSADTPTDTLTSQSPA